MARYMKALECDLKAGRLKKRLGKWIGWKKGRFLVNAIKGDSDDPQLLMKLLFIVFIAIKLRDCASIFSMYHVTQPAIDQLKGFA